MTGSVRRAAIAAALLAAALLATSIAAVSIVATAGLAAVAGRTATAGSTATAGLATAGRTATASFASAGTAAAAAQSIASAGTAANFTLAKYAKNSKKSKKRNNKKKKSSGIVASPLTGAAQATALTGDAATEAQVNALISAERTANGCRAMRTDGRLTAAARAHSSDMVTKNFFSHTGSDGSDFVARESRAGYVNASAENIAWGWSTAATVVKEWMKSPGHRANILNCGNIAVGVGLARKADGTPYWTQDFGRV
jgi:uncharacterized protein YkwD